jgi:glycine/D-amino acid oxidase-like deaminating enzyme/nitrite reductase/ring-hydroxylating ferredoxin subunit
MDPLRYVRGLAGAIRARGARIYTNCRAISITGGERARVQTASDHRITANHVVVATNVPINDLIAIHTKQEANRSYVIAAPIEPGELPDALYWDLADPYHYARLAAGPDGEMVLIVGGEDHRTGRPAEGAERWARLEHWARVRFPGMGPVRWRWSGQIIEPVDAIPFIGRNPMDAENVYTATGDSGDGTTNGTIAARLIADLILGHENPYAGLYEASRLTVKATAEFARTNLEVAQHYGDWLTPGDVADVGKIPPGSGAVMRDGLSKIAVYRDEAGSLHKCSAICPHLKCIVGWNDAEKSWDCPCHGSRFDRYGRLVNGPANEGLGEP